MPSASYLVVIPAESTPAGSSRDFPSYGGYSHFPLGSGWLAWNSNPTPSDGSSVVAGVVGGLLMWMIAHLTNITVFIHIFRFTTRDTV